MVYVSFSLLICFSFNANSNILYSINFTNLINYLFFEDKRFYKFKIFLIGSSLCILIFFCLFFTKTPFENFIYQYILFPLTIGEGRITSKEIAYISLIDQFNLKRLIGEFKFIHIFFIPLVFLSIKEFKKNSFEKNNLNFIIILSVLAFIFNQIITANQIYVFSLIPILAAILQINLENLRISSKFIYILFFITLFATTKYHFRYNIDKKFHDLENIDKNQAINANIIHKNFNNLKWISKNGDPEEEINIIKNVIETLESDKRKKTLITHYQFISTVLDKNLNILNRWYLWDNNTHPTENHRYFEVYKSLINNNIKKNEVKVIYLFGEEKEIEFKNIKNYFTDTCFESKTIIQNRFTSHKLIKCKK